MKWHKYGAQRTEIDGIKFDSKREAARYAELKLLQDAGQIRALSVQPKFDFRMNGNKVLIRSEGYPNGRQASYRADFMYRRDGDLVVEDVKGQDTPLSRLKRAMVEAQYGVKVEVVK